MLLYKCVWRGEEQEPPADWEEKSEETEMANSGFLPALRLRYATSVVQTATPEPLKTLSPTELNTAQPVCLETEECQHYY